jgi:sec-independent protein translocase protein TatC
MVVGSSTIAILILATVTFFVSDYIFDVIILVTNANFVTYRFFCDLSNQLGFAESICVTDMPFIIQNTNMEAKLTF